MPLSLRNSRAFRWPLKLLKYCSVLLFIVILLVSVILIFLPTVVSTEWSQGFIKDQISNALDRPVALETINWSWADGIIINNLEIPDSPEFSKNSLVSLENIKLKFKVKRLLHREIKLEFLVSNLNVNIIKSTDEKLNIQTLGQKDLIEEKPPAPSEKKKKDQKEKKPLVLPMDVSAQIRFTGINLLYDDRKQSKKYKVKDLEICLDAPSLKTAPIHLSVGTDILVNDLTVPRSELNVSVDNLFDSDGALNINGLLARLDADLPGIVANINANMKASDIKTNVQVDLASIMNVAGPLIPDFPSPTDIKGSVELIASSGARPEAPLAFDVMLSGADLAVSGKVIDGKSIGPGNFSVHLNGIMDLEAEQLNLKTGEIHFLENSYMNASAKVEEFKQENKKVNLAISPLFLDINELTEFARPFIPASVEINDPGKKSDIIFEELQFAGMLPKGQADVMLDGLQINFPQIILKDKGENDPMLQVFGTRINLEKLTAQLTDLFPASAKLKLSIAVNKLLSKNAPNEIIVSGIQLDHLNVDIKQLNKSDESKFGIFADVAIDNKLDIEKILLPDIIEVNDLTQSIQLDADLRENSTIMASMDHLDVSSEKISVLKPDFSSMETGFSLQLALTNLFLKNTDPLNLDVKNFIADLKLDNALAVSLVANAIDTADTSFNTDIQITSDIKKLTDKIPPKFIPGISGKGNLNITLNADGRRPTEYEITALKEKQLTDNLSFIDHLNFDVNIDNGFVEVSQKDQNPITISSITARPLLFYLLNGKTGKGAVSGLINTGSVQGLPGIDSKTPVSAKFSLSASHDYAAFIDLNQSLSVAPSGINEIIHITIHGLGRMISQTPMPPVSAWLSKTGAKISADIALPDGKALKQLGIPGLSEIDLDGRMAAGIDVNLLADQSAGGSIFLTVKDMNFSKSDTISVENMDANIDFSKSYFIQSAAQVQAISGTGGLSANVFESAAQPFLSTQHSDIYRHIRLLHERMNPKPAMSFEKADVLAAPFPLIIDESLVMLNLDNGLPNLDYFQFDLLGGSVNGSIALLKKAANGSGDKNYQFNVNTALTFSGINTAQIFPRAFSKDDYSKANISGALYADIPITDQLQTLLENINITVEFTRIGSRALERMLYALDPYESNEAIVSQRLLLKNGSPKKIRLDIKDGFLSLRGKIAVKGIEINLPAIRRLNIAQIPGLDKFGEKLSALTPVTGILQKMSAEHIIIDKQTNTITFK